MSTTLAEALQNLSDEKDNMVAALVAKGVSIDDTAGFADITTAISNVGPVKLTAVTSGISQSDMYVLNVGDKTLVFGSFTKSSTGASVFSFPDTFNFAHTSTYSAWLYAADSSNTSGARSTSSNSYSVNTTTKQVTLYCYAANTKYYYTYWFR